MLLIAGICFIGAIKEERSKPGELISAGIFFFIIANFALFFTHCLAIGGDALNGSADNGCWLWAPSKKLIATTCTT